MVRRLETPLGNRGECRYIIVMKPVFLALVSVFSLPLSALAELTFEKTRVDLDAKPEDKTVTANFKFINKTGEPIAIRDIHTNCGCISATADKQSYAPGESGVIEGIFKVGSTAGKLVKSIKVETKNSKGKFQKLVVGVQVPELFQISPNLTQWEIGEEVTTKTISFKVVHDDPIKITEVSSSRQNMNIELRTIKEGREYAIDVTPKSTDNVTLGVVRIQTDCDIKRHRRKMAFVGVVKKKRRQKG